MPIVALFDTSVMYSLLIGSKKVPTEVTSKHTVTKIIKFYRIILRVITSPKIKLQIHAIKKAVSKRVFLRNLDVTKIAIR